MKYAPTAEMSICQQKADEVFERLPKLIADAAPVLSQGETEDAIYILKLWGDYCDLIGLAVPDNAPTQKIDFDTAEMRSEAAQDVFYALQVRAQELEGRTQDRLSETQRAEMATIHALAAESGTGCGSLLMSGGGPK